jgi:hypothetical protein
MKLNRTNRWALTAFLAVVVIALGLIVIATAPNSHAASSAQPASWQAPRCAEDEVIAIGGSCRTYDDTTTRWYRASKAGWGYWYDARYPGVLKRRLADPVVPACHRWQMVTHWGGCVATVRGDFRGGWWYHR